ncbi:MAG: CvpA family protein [Phaeodactylibacter sp.]|nr:CvpA family protein [Phaeodactylibacter sp.]MCB9051245.1 CvpA family protein [Lewinellaceae bacterium]
MAIDLIFLVLAGWGFYLGFSRGIIKTIFTIFSVVFGLMMAFRFGPEVTGILESMFNENPLMFIAGFLLTFVGTMFIIRFFANLLEGALETANINFINQIIGGFFLTAIFVLVYSLILWFADTSHLLGESTKQESRSYYYLERYPQKVWAWGRKAKPIFEDFWDHSIEFMDDLENMSVERRESAPEFYDIPENDRDKERR